MKTKKQNKAINKIILKWLDSHHTKILVNHSLTTVASDITANQHNLRAV